MNRRGLLAGLAALAAVPVFAAEARAQNTFPERPVRLVVPYGPGTATDAVARQVSAGMGALLGQPVVVENRAGANAIIGSEAVARSAPDGHTLLFANDQIACLNPALFVRLPYNLSRDFAPVAGLATISYVLAVTSGLNVRSVAELVALAKSRPGRLTFGSTAVGSGSHILGEVFARDAGVELTHVPYSSGASQVFGDLIAGRISLIFYPYGALKPHVEAGALRLLAVASADRSAWLPDVPTLRELGFPRTIYTSWFAVYAPAGTASGRIGRMAEAFRGALDGPEIRTTLPAIGASVAFQRPEELGAFTAAEGDRCRTLVGLSGARVE